MKIVSYNINGVRASKRNGILDWLQNFDADIYCLQEVRASEEIAKKEIFEDLDQLSFLENENKLKKYTPHFNCGKISGYAGTLTLSKQVPDKIFLDMGNFWQDDEGRTTTTIFGKLAVVNAYIPNGNSRLEFKMNYLASLTKYLEKLAKDYDVLCVGDFNIAHNEIDLTNPKECRHKSVFLPEERQAFSELLSKGFLDCFRFLNPNLVKYSWRSYRSRNDKNFNGWKYRIDYAICSNSLKNRLVKCDILDLDYSDHLPVIIEIK